MLSYKLKHLCSRVIASLSAFGLFSINSSAHSATSLSGAFENAQPGDYFTYRKTAGMTMTANMAAQAKCSMAASATKIKSVDQIALRITDVSGVARDVSGCRYICKDGFYAAGTSGLNGGFYTGNEAGMSFTFEATDSLCVPVASCNTNGNSTISNGVIKLQSNAGESNSGVAPIPYKGSCTWTCADGYSVDGGSSTTNTFSGATGMSGVITPDKSCNARTFKVSFDCGEGATYGSTSAQTGAATATYGSQFTIPTAATCKRTDYKFNGWKGSTN